MTSRIEPIAAVFYRYFGVNSNWLPDSMKDYPHSRWDSEVLLGLKLGGPLDDDLFELINDGIGANRLCVFHNIDPWFMPGEHDIVAWIIHDDRNIVREIHVSYPMGRRIAHVSPG